MWRSALATYEDPQTNYLFFPEKVTQVHIEKVKLGIEKITNNVIGNDKDWASRISSFTELPMAAYRDE